MQTTFKTRLMLVLIGALAASFFTVLLSNATQIARPKPEAIRFIAPDQLMSVALTTHADSAAESLAQDSAANDMQVVVIAAKRLKHEEKIAFDKEAARAIQANAAYNKMLRKTV